VAIGGFLENSHLFVNIYSLLIYPSISFRKKLVVFILKIMFSKKVFLKKVKKLYVYI
jgi:hypothetical protein